MSNVVLGVMTDFTAVQDGDVSFHVTVERIKAIIDLFELYLERGIMYPHEAASLRGKIFFTLSAGFARVGCAATLPLVQRQYRDRTYEFHTGSDLYQSYLFFKALLPRLPRLVMPLNPPSRPPLVVYTDAAFWLKGRPPPPPGLGSQDVCAADMHLSRLRGGLGAVVYDPADKSARAAYSDPPWALLMTSWQHDKKTYIAELEALAAVAVYSTYPDMFVGRRVIHWVDNTVALAALVHGYSGKPDLAKAVNVFYLQSAALRTSVYLDWVPSKANIADLPSRKAFGDLQRELCGLGWDPSMVDSMRVPSVGQWHAPLESWFERFDRPQASNPT